MKIHRITQRIARTVRKLAAVGAALSGLIVGEVGSAQMLGSVPSAADQPSVPGGTITHGSETFEVVDAGSVPTAASQGGSVASLPTSGPGRRHGHAAAGGCRGCGGGAVGGSAGDAGSAMACPRCDPYSYVTVEGLWMRRRGDNDFSLARNFRLDDFEHQWTPRLTFGSVPDCVDGWEASFTGPLEWELAASAFSGADTLQTLLIPEAPIVGTDLDSFNNARSQSQSYEADYWSAEFSRTSQGWEVIKVLYGLRYIDYSEEYRYRTVDVTDGNGLLRSDTDNSMIGGQVGLDLLYPVARYAYVDMRGRAGLYLNLAESDVDIINDGVSVVSFSPDEKELAGVFELATGLRYQLGEMLSVRGGGEIWYLSGIATAPDQIGAQVGRSFGSSLNVDDDIFVVGLNVGAELKY